MLLVNNKNGKLEYIKEIGFKLEKDMQSLTENNFKELFGLDFISTEFQLNNLRIDSVAFDEENNSFVIIEYKRGSSYSVIDQGFSYLSLLLNNKANFVLLLSQKKNKILKIEDIDWSQSRVIFIADSFTRYQQESINFKDLPIELWEMKQFSNGNIVYNQIKAANATESIKTITKFDSEIKEIEKEIKTYTEEDHLNGKSEKIIEIYENLKKLLFEIDNNIAIIPKKLYIAFKINKTNIIDIEIRKNDLKIWINLKHGELNDLYGITRNVKNTGHWGNGDYEIKIDTGENLIKVLDLIQQAYKKYN
ncbi:MAG: DUF5655 domain-containing protein [Candidatus Gracilibacteria bacterium]|nr:DUF5655 domain-containing protein [Candidatus Gracilibacteria bacterium]MDD2908207.1 DUF5655 domain-containing protein [Candidatus Gracilibacteria bacterium]